MNMQYEFYKQIIIYKIMQYIFYIFFVSIIDLPER